MIDILGISNDITTGIHWWQVNIGSGKGFVHQARIHYLNQY